jgi:hypothetical protein
MRKFMLRMKSTSKYLRGRHVSLQMDDAVHNIYGQQIEAVIAGGNNAKEDSEKKRTKSEAEIRKACVRTLAIKCEYYGDKSKLVVNAFDVEHPSLFYIFIDVSLPHDECRVTGKCGCDKVVVLVSEHHNSYVAKPRSGDYKSSY